MLKQKLLGFDLVEFTQHALSRMAQRGITRDDVYRTVGNPDYTGLATAPHRHRVRWDKSVNFCIDVVYEICPKHIRIVTAMRVCDNFRGVAPTIVRMRKDTSRFSRVKHKGNR